MLRFLLLFFFFFKCLLKTFFLPVQENLYNALIGLISSQKINKLEKNINKIVGPNNNVDNTHLNEEKVIHSYFCQVRDYNGQIGI